MILRRGIAFPAMRTGYDNRERAKEGNGGSGTVFQLKRILVPIDFSVGSEKALQYAASFARQFGAELTLLYVISPIVMLPASDGTPPALGPESIAAAREGLETWQKKLGAGVASTSLVRNGSPPLEIIDAARDLDADLIILSTHGHTGLKHILLGATAEKVVRRASCPVLIVREHEHEFITITETPA